MQEIQDKLQPLIMRYRQEKARVDEIRRLRQKQEEIKRLIQEAESRYDLARAADLKYGALQEIEDTLKRLEVS
jgi:ATP-dependent Clp protease ATP-binding subunit ClpB